MGLAGGEFEIRKGESVGLVGRNGAGKSTFLQLAAGIIQPTTGSVTAHGRIAALLELGAGFNPEFTGAENVRLSAAILGLSSEEIEDRFQSIAEFAAIGDFINLPVKLYSSGMYARLAFAVAAHVDASILIVDEILAVGDAAFTQKCMRFIRKFRENGTLIFVSHSPSSVVSLCDRAIWIDGGEVQEIGDAKVVCDNYLASLDRERDNGASFKIGGRRRSTMERPASTVSLPKAVNPIQVFSFDPEASWYGRRGATIESVRFLDANRLPLQIMHGGEEVILQIRCSIADELSSPIVGFYIRDRLGQNLFGDNTYLHYVNDPVAVRLGQELHAEFRFEMPYLPTGQYSVCCAIANGTQQDHVQHHWYDEALIFDVASSHIVRGLVGIPMLGVDLHPVEVSEAAALPATNAAMSD
ncbi:ABC transporter ATP-binding protein [Nitrospirillum sp. BR 11163]|uniref:ABC transporter ATP-binding protein n=1 Tax=Nitrospirillum sp. BR 11163 TaxID=3104323 RepID=UPI002AFF3571|nr:Wzt carbohydrate-binding domain-containing protein [Nitrospirillum sp. BR 11163]MEA1672501.1 Wzt carbohydrate-binding domain-containing protein [Nitrospirillum sp. BR 11163]